MKRILKSIIQVINHRTNDKCYMKFEPYSYFGGTPKKVTGTITSAEGKVEWVLNGTWDSKIEGSKVIGEATVKGKSSLEIGASKLLWKMQRNDEGAEKYYNFRCVLKKTKYILNSLTFQICFLNYLPCRNFVLVFL